MTSVGYVRAHVLPAAFALLPSEMASDRATAMLMAIGYQESKFEARRQIGGGPATGYWQFEQGGGIIGVLRHEATRGIVAVMWKRLGYTGSPTPFGLWIATEHNDVIAAICARLLLWTMPDPMPSVTEPEKGWAIYQGAWRPGRPRPSDWPESWDVGWGTR